MSSVAYRPNKADIFYENPKNWVELAMVNVRAVKNAVNCTRTGLKIILRLNNVIKIGISISAATLKVVMKLTRLLNEQKM